jgi:hypothetical protein
MNRRRWKAYTKADRNTDTTIDATKIKAITAANVFLVLGLLKFSIGFTSIRSYYITLFQKGIQ